jgi:G:T-mismatch repair DNA endonuclease (very short patch repair protein)
MGVFGTDDWRTKILGNKKRDRAVTRMLKKAGWRVLRIWEHELSTKNSRVCSGASDALFLNVFRTARNEFLLRRKGQVLTSTSERRPSPKELR